MSQGTGILCKSCNEILNSEDDIFASSCGHLYHFSCIREYHGKSTTCLHCNSYKPMMFKMYLEFGKVSQPIPWKDQEKTIELFNQLEETKRDSTFFNNALTISKESIQKLEAKIKVFKDAIQAKENIVYDLEDRIATLEELNKFLSTTNNNNSNHNAEIKNHGAISKKNNNNRKYKQNQKKQNHSKKVSQKRYNDKNTSGDEKDDIVKSEELQEQPNELQDTFIHTDMSPNMVMIRNIKAMDREDQQAEYIIFLARQMNLQLNIAHIKDSFVFLEEKNYALIIEFIDKNIKDKFIKKKNILKFFTNTQYLEFVYND